MLLLIINDCQLNVKIKEEKEKKKKY